MGKLFNITAPAEGDYFIGRQAECSYIWNQVFKPAAEGSSYLMALTGMHKIGKTSIVKKLCRQFQEEKHENVYLVEATMQGYSMFWEFWVNEVIEPLLHMISLRQVAKKSLKWAWELWKCRRYFAKKSVRNRLYKRDAGENDNARKMIKLLFNDLTRCGKHTLLIFDEFDCAVKIFADEDDKNFSWLRTLLQSGFGISMLTLSRRSIYYIETSAVGGSTLHGIFETHGLGGFKNCDIDAYFKRLEKYNLTTTQKEEILYYCGRSPYYLAIMGDVIENGALEQTENMEEVFAMRGSQYYDNFKDIIKLLKQENLLTAMLQMFVGPVCDLKSDSVNRLMGMGYCTKQTAKRRIDENVEYVNYIARENKRQYLTVCEKFIEFLEEEKTEEVNGIWPKLSQAERLLRKIIQEEAQKEFQDDWERCLNELIDELLSTESRERIDDFFINYKSGYIRIYMGESAAEVGCCKLSVVNLMMIQKIIVNDWERYKKYFNGLSLEKLKSNLKELYKARNPLAHNNTELLTPEQVDLVGRICDDMVKRISAAY